MNNCPDGVAVVTAGFVIKMVILVTAAENETGVI